MKVAVKTRDRREQLEKLVDRVVRGELRMRQLPLELSAEEAGEVRRRVLQTQTGVELRNVGYHSLDADRAASRNCENFIGVAQVPMGVVGPLRVRGDHVDDEVFVPLATTEGALVASVNRGCSALTQSGGARTVVEDIGMTRAPVFKTRGLEQTREFLAWIDEHTAEMSELSQQTSRHLHLKDVRPFTFGTSVFLRFRFSSGDAMGMNMATIACDRIVRRLIEPGTGIDCIALSGNYCVDKKPAAINFHEGRGKRIQSEITISGDVLERCLKTRADRLVEVQYRKTLMGSTASGAIGSNAHYANILAAFFIATGQDLAHVVEGSMGVTCIEPRDDGVHASVFLPAVPLGAIGGGTGLDTQQEGLRLLGVQPDSDRPGEATLRLAEILGATVLAGELSLLSAITSGDLTRAHERLARGKSTP